MPQPAAHLVGMTTIHQDRVRSGQPTGGQFSGRTRTDSTITLGAEYPEVYAATSEHYAMAQAEVARRKASGRTVADWELDSIASRFAEQGAAYAAHLAGEPHSHDPYYEAIWDGAGGGFSREAVIDDLGYVRRTRDQLAVGLVDPAAVTNQAAATHADAESWLDERQELLEEALGCRGKNLTMNQASVINELRRSEPTPPF